MRQHQALLITIVGVCVVVLGCALYLQLVEDMLPCPLCVAQRYAFAAIGLISLLLLFLPLAAQRVGAAIATLLALCGAGIAVHHLWVLAHPETSCGIDPVQTFLNKWPTAQVLPVLFKASGFCDTPYPPIMGLSIPAWSLLWLSVLSIALLSIVFRRPAARRVFAN
jgi:disulfide bond formation protein DsbB